MAAFNFPNSPSTNDLHTENSVTWKWNGTVWKRVNNSYLTASTLDVTGIGTFSSRVLIGTATEGNAGSDDLTIATSGSTGITVRSGTSSNGNLYFSDGTSGDYEYRGSIQYQHANNALLFATDAAERLHITSDGKIGIGEDDPDGNYLLIRAASTVGTTKGHIMLTGDSATNGQGPQIVFSESGSGSSFAGAYIGHVRTTTNSVGDLVFGTRATGGDANTIPTERLRITSNGYVRIGGNEGNYPLVVIDESNRTTTADTQLHLYAKHDGSGTTGVGFGGGIRFWGDRASGNVEQNMGRIMCIADVNSGTTLSSAFTFETGVAGILGEKVRITSGGQTYFKETVGIQTNDVTRANLSNPVGAGHSLVGMYIGDGSLLFNNTLNRTGGYYISTETNALNAGPVTLDANMKIDGAWVIV